MISLDSPVSLLHGAVEDALQYVPDNCADAVVTDPPYALAMGGGTKGWDDYSPRGFAAWCELWSAECLRIAKPGAWMLAASSARTVHRLTQGMEDAGWQIIDAIDWVYPLSLHRAISLPTRLAKAEVDPAVIDSVAGRSTALQSRREPFVLARAPLERGLLNTVATYGTATLDVVSTAAESGSGPSNLVFSHSELCVEGGDCYPGCPHAALGIHASMFPAFYWCDKPTSAERPRVEVEVGKGTGKLSTIGENRRWKCRVCNLLTHSYMKRGSTYSSVPQKVCPHYDEDPANYEPLRINDYVSEISHNTVKPLRLMRWMIRLTSKPGDTILEPFSGSGTTTEAAVLERRRVIAIERDIDSIELTRSRLRRSHCSRLDRIVLQEAQSDRTEASGG
jgi:site-specific DNA-methyltransferase (adenine-specific)